MMSLVAHLNSGVPPFTQIRLWSHSLRAISNSDTVLTQLLSDKIPPLSVHPQSARSE